jgi:hypothetical protein
MRVLSLSGSARTASLAYERLQVFYARPKSCLPRPAVNMIAATVVPLRQIDKLAANARRTGQVREAARLRGHLAVIVAAGKRGPRFARGQTHPGSNASPVGATIELSLQ